MKRKRGCGRRKPKKPPVVGANDVFPNVVRLNAEDHSAVDDFDNAEFDCGMEAETPQADINRSDQQTGFGKQVVNGNLEDSANSLREMNIAISGNLSKKVEGVTTKSSRGFGSSSINPDSNAVLVHGERTLQKELRFCHHNPRYNEQELNAALLVIKNIMKMDASEPFNVPVNPIALGIPDYFDVIDTPMDFGTIFNNLENGLKYLNSEDVLKDVQFIWQNCCKYNKKGDYILELMKRVKKNFMKYWNAAGLCGEQPQAINGHSHLPRPTDSAMRRSKRVNMCPGGPRTSYPIDEQPGLKGPSQVQHHQLSPSNNHAYQPQQRACQCQLSSREPQPSQTQTGTNFASAGHLHFTPTESTIRHNQCAHMCPVGCMNGNQQQYETSLSQVQPHQPSSSYNLLCNCQSRSSQLQPSQLQAGINVCTAGHSNLLTPTESTMRRSKCGQECLGGHVADKPGHQQEDQTVPSQVQSHQPSLIYSLANQPQHRSFHGQPSSSEPQPSLSQAGTNIGSVDSTSIQRRGRGPTRCLKLWHGEGKCISIATNELGQPIGLEAPKLTNFLGTMARNGHMAPLTYVDWRAMPDANKENMWQQVQLKFDIDPKSKSWVLKSLGKKWKDWKSKLKAAHYNTHATDEERLADRDERVLPDQWSILISHWNSKEGEKRSATNKANRAQQKFSHTTGTKSFARVREEQRAKRPDGKEPSRAELFIFTRTRKNGQPVNEASSVVISQLHEQATQPQDISQNSTAQDDIFSRVMGQDRHGRVRIYGLGPSPSDLGGPKPTRVEAMRMVSEANAEVREMKQRMMTMEQTCTQMAEQMATMMSMMSSMQRSFPEKHLSSTVANTSGASEGSLQQQVRPSPSCHAVSSRETRAMKRGKMQNASTSKVAQRGR